MWERGYVLMFGMMRWNLLLCGTCWFGPLPGHLARCLSCWMAWAPWGSTYKWGQGSGQRGERERERELNPNDIWSFEPSACINVEATFGNYCCRMSVDIVDICWHSIFKHCDPTQPFSVVGTQNDRRIRLVWKWPLKALVLRCGFACTNWLQCYRCHILAVGFPQHMSRFLTIRRGGWVPVHETALAAPETFFANFHCSTGWRKDCDSASCALLRFEGWHKTNCSRGFWFPVLCCWTN